MKKINKLSTALLVAVVSTITVGSAHAFIDPKDWKPDRWGKWDEWEGPPDMKEWKNEQWDDLDQWGPDGWQTPWGSQPWRGNRGGWGGMPWGGGDRGGWGGMPWGGGNRDGWGGMPWGGNRGWGGGPWGGNRGYRGHHPYGQMPHHVRPPQQLQPAAPEKDRYPRRPAAEEPAASAE